MLQALWSLEVLRAGTWTPAGVLIFHLRRVFGDYYQEGRLFGGDRQSHYVGEYRIENLGLTGRFVSTRYAGVDPTPIGDQDSFEVTFTGTLEAGLERDVLILTAGLRGDQEPTAKLRLTKTRASHLTDAPIWPHTTVIRSARAAAADKLFHLGNDTFARQWRTFGLI